jgi:hypothetical protein
VTLDDLVGIEGSALELLGWVRPGWWVEAACRGQGAARFFPAATKSERERAAALDDARQVCEHCPAVAPCLQSALTIPHSVDRSGIFGGTDWHQRVVLRALGSPAEVAAAWAAGSLNVDRHQVA